MSKVDPKGTEHHGDALEGLDLLLEHAFGLESAGSSAHVAPRDSDAVELAPGSLLGERYSVAEELARGGIGVLFRAHDTVVDREVALKVLQRRHAGRNDLLRRFTAEARICGGLQHPGIVPVHDAGTCPDGRPFLVMKLVRGETLAARFARSADDAMTRQDNLAVLERVCQAIGYAHACGVVHRDLKPSNVMVGDFGEVQVMDFGLAKLLRESTRATSDDESAAADVLLARVPRHESASESISGSVMGTYAYMPPEQARGDLNQVGRQSDVFSLGAMLCQVLTSAPPYVGAREDLRRAAVAADLDAAFERLAACGADAELVELCRSCLAVEPRERPADAAAIAVVLGEYRASLVARARGAETAAARAEERLVGEGRRRRLQAAFFLSLSVLALIGGGAYVIAQRAAARRTVLVGDAVDHAIASARSARAGFEGPDGHLADGASFDAALASARQAKLLAESPDADRATVERARACFAEVEAAELAARAALEESLTNSRVRHDLREVRLELARTFDWQAADRGYTAAFATYGLDLTRGTEEEIADLLRRSAIASELTDGIDEWRRVKASLSPADEALASRFYRVLQLADLDPIRARVREALVKRDLSVALALVEEVRDMELAPSTAARLARALSMLGADTEAIAVAKRALIQHPADFWLNFELGQIAWIGEPKRPAEAVRHWSVSYAVEPRSLMTATNLAAALKDAQELDEAIALSRSVVQRAPLDADLHANLGILLEAAGRIEDALEVHRAASALDPARAGSRMAIAQMLKRLGRIEEARSVYETAITEGVVHADLYLSYGAMQCDQLGDPAGAVASFQKVLELNPRECKGYRNLVIALCKLGRHEDALPLLPGWLTLEPGSSAALRLSAEVYFKTGHSAEAREHYTAAVAANPGDAGTRFSLAVVLDDLGDVPGAIRELREATRLAPDHKNSWYMLAYHLQTTNELDAARAAIGEALRLAPEWANAHFQLSRILWLQGEREASHAALTRVLELDPEHEDAKQAIKEFEDK
jgi:tetratricopeptide (TPR) repeat protein/tRNA A-37 threonylcarbamoyl transferase component Bud32